MAVAEATSARNDILPFTPMTLVFEVVASACRSMRGRTGSLECLSANKYALIDAIFWIFFRMISNFTSYIDPNHRARGTEKHTAFQLKIPEKSR